MCEEGNRDKVIAKSMDTVDVLSHELAGES